MEADIVTLMKGKEKGTFHKQRWGRGGGGETGARHTACKGAKERDQDLQLEVTSTKKHGK